MSFLVSWKYSFIIKKLKNFSQKREIMSYSLEFNLRLAPMSCLFNPRALNIFPHTHFFAFSFSLDRERGREREREGEREKREREEREGGEGGEGREGGE